MHNKYTPPAERGARKLRISMQIIISGMLLSGQTLAAGINLPDPSSITLPEITVSEEAIKNQSDISINAETLPANVEVISSERAASLPVTDYHDLFRSTPGVVPINFGQGDIGNGFSLRGFAGDHGSEVAVFVDGVPINVPNHAHQPGLADDAWLTPEMIDKIEVIKGPFSALYGNFALGGVVNITTKRSDEHLSVEARLGTDGARRVVGVYSHPLTPKGLTPFLVYEVDHRDGYRENSEYNRYNIFNKLTTPIGNGALSVTARAHKRDFGAAGYLPLEDIKDGITSRRAAINDTDGGDSAYYALVANYIPNGESGLNATVYAGADELNRYADFRRPSDPTGQRQDHSERSYFGWRAFYNLTFGDRAALTLGTDGQYDDGTYQRFGTNGRREHTDIRRDRRVTQLGTGLFAQGQLKLVEHLKVVGGLRYDRFDIDVDNRVRPDISGEATPDVVSPKIGVVYSPFPQLDIFANTGKGFRSPAAEELSPNGTAAANFNIDPPEVRSSDIGAKFRPLPGLNLSVDYYTSKIEGEISQMLVGPQLEFVNIGKTNRDGYELAVDYAFNPNLDLFASYSAVDARLDNKTRDYVANVPFDIQTLGATWRKPLPNGMRLTVDGYVQRYGRQPLTGDKSLQSRPVTRFAVKTNLSRGPISGFVQFTYFPDKFASESVFDFGAPEPPPGELPDAKKGIRYAPNPDIEALVGIKYEFE